MSSFCFNLNSDLDIQKLNLNVISNFSLKSELSQPQHFTPDDQIFINIYHFINEKLQ